MKKNLMLVPSLDCPADCKYCFGPNRGGPVMSEGTIDDILGWIYSLGWEAGPNITFHGGEPLTAGTGYYRMALAKLAGGLRSKRPRFAMQSNLWLLTDEFCEILSGHGVSIGTSLDGPEHINDPQRGRGYFRRTMEGIELARSHGLEVGCVCTFTSISVRHAGEIFEFFKREGLNFTIHPALPGIGSRGEDALALSPEAFGVLLVEMLHRYLDNLGEVWISTLDSLCHSVSARRGGTCIFGDCLGGYLAIGPEGDIFPCQRFSGLQEYRLGSVHERPSMEALRTNPVWRAWQERQERIRSECGGCPHVDYCRGGCPFNVLAAAEGYSAGSRDPYCTAYRRIFEHVGELALEEVFSPENIAAVVEQRDPDAGLFQRGGLLDLMKGGRC